MTSTSTDPRDIEAELERDRANLASTLDELSDRVSVDNLARDALNTVKSYAGSYTSSVDGAVRSNPLAVALIGAGVAWLTLGGRLRGSASTSSQGSNPMGHPVHDELPRWESEGGPPPSYGAVAYRPTTSQGDDDDRSWWDSIHDLRSKASAALQRIEEEAKGALGRVTSGVSGGAGAARDFAAERASVVSGFTGDLKGRLAHGLDGIPEPARSRILATRERAYAASLEAERVGRQAITDPARALEEHPLVAGAVAFALGATVAAMLPRTEAEDRAFGTDAERLRGEATRLLQSERQRAMQIAGSLAGEVKAAATDAAASIAGEVKAAASEAVSNVTDAAKSQVQEAAQRMGDRANDEANRLADDGRPNPVIG